MLLSSYRKPVIMGRAEEGEKVFTQAQHGYLISYITRNRRCTSVSGSACTSTYGIRKAYLLCRLLCWFWPQTSYNTGRQRSPTESENKMGKVRMLSSVNGTGHLWARQEQNAWSRIPTNFELQSSHSLYNYTVTQSDETIQKTAVI